MISVAGSLAAMNMLLVVVCGGLSIYTFSRIRHYRSKDKELATAALGLGLFAGGWALQRAYWAVNRSLEAIGEEYLLTTLFRLTSWVTLIPMTLVIIGAGLLLSPVLQGFYGAYWFQKYLVCTGFAWLVMALLI